MTQLTDFDVITDAQSTKPDAGLAALEKLNAKRRTRRLLWLVFALFVLSGLIALAAMGYLVYQEYLKPGVRVTDYRECRYEDPEQKLTLTGKREYSYMQKEFYGIQYRQGDQVLEKTVLDVKGSAMSIVGLSQGNWKAVYVGEGEQGVQILMPAELYVVTQGKKVGVFNYHEFCK